MNELQNADLPRPRKKPEQDYLYDPEEELPELRRSDTKRFPVQSTPQQEVPQSTLRFRKSSVEEHYFDDTDEDIYYDPEPEEDFSYGAYEAYDAPEPEQQKENFSDRPMKKNHVKSNAQNSVKSGSGRQTGKQSVQKSPSKKSVSQKSRTSRKKSHGGGILKRLIRKILILAMILFGIYSAIALLLISKLEKLPRAPRMVTSGTLDAGYVQNILLIGTDARDMTTERGRSDTVLLLSLNSRTEKIYLTSFMRDAYVEIPGYGSNKLNAAYAYGGAELLMDTLEQNYQISVDDYFCVSFMGFAGIIDAFGGVEIDVSDAEAQAVNEILQSEVNSLAGDDIMADLLEKGGKCLLNGKQALSYARIRYVGNADFERTSRQREVMTQIFQNVKTKAVTAVPELVSSALPHVGANMSTMDLYFLSLKAPLAVSYEIEQLQVPADGTYTPADIDGQSVLQVDCSANTQILKDIIYSVPEPTEYTGSVNP